MAASRRSTQSFGGYNRWVLNPYSPIKMQSVARRGFRALFALLFASLLLACSADKPSFKGIDLTGSKQDIGFTMTDAEGRERTLADFRGSYVLVFFGFTQCPDVCPTTLARAAEVKKKLGVDGNKLKVVFISVDPERDSAELMRNYLKVFDAEFVGFRGTPEQTKAAAKAFNVFFEKVTTGSSYTINHTAITYVLDAQGRLRLGMRHAQEADDYVADLRTLMKQAS
ncbi:MAG: SCO family protein [Burkholderiales bacterium]